MNDLPFDNKYGTRRAYGYAIDIYGYVIDIDGIAIDISTDYRTY